MSNKIITADVLNTYGAEIKGYVDAHDTPIKIIAAADLTKTTLLSLYTEYPDKTFYFETTSNTAGASAFRGLLHIGFRASNTTYTIYGWTCAVNRFKSHATLNIPESAMGLTLADLTSGTSADGKSNTYGEEKEAKYKISVAPDLSKSVLSISAETGYQTSAGKNTYSTAPNADLAFDGASNGILLSKNGWMSPSFTYGQSPSYTPIGMDDNTCHWDSTGTYVFNSEGIIKNMTVDHSSYGYDYDFVGNGIDMKSGYTNYKDGTIKLYANFNSLGEEILIFEYDPSTSTFLSDVSKQHPFSIDASQSESLTEKTCIAMGQQPSTMKFLSIYTAGVIEGTITTKTTTGVTNLSAFGEYVANKGLKLYRHTMRVNTSSASNVLCVIFSTRATAYTDYMSDIIPDLSSFKIVNAYLADGNSTGMDGFGGFLQGYTSNFVCLDFGTYGTLNPACTIISDTVTEL